MYGQVAATAITQYFVSQATLVHVPLEGCLFIEVITASACTERLYGAFALFGRQTVVLRG